MKLSTAYAQAHATPGPAWAMYFHAGTEWLQLWQLIDERRYDDTAGPLFYVEPHVVHFCVELFVKALIIQSEPTFDPKTNGHRTLDNIIQHSSASPLFAKILADKQLAYLVREYEKTVDTRFGETSVQIDGEDTRRMIGLAYEMRVELCGKTGLR